MDIQVIDDGYTYKYNLLKIKLDMNTVHCHSFLSIISKYIIQR